MYANQRGFPCDCLVSRMPFYNHVIVKWCPLEREQSQRNKWQTDDCSSNIADVQYVLYHNFNDLSHWIVFTILWPETNTGDVMI